MMYFVDVFLNRGCGKVWHDSFHDVLKCKLYENKKINDGCLCCPCRLLYNEQL